MPHLSLPSPRSRRPQYLIAGLLAAAVPLTAFATSRTYTGGDNSNFGTATNWNPNAVPGANAGDVLTVGDTPVSGLSGDLHVTLNGVFLNISSVTFDSVALPQALIITETGGTLSTTTENLGVDAFGNTFNQGSGSANIASNLTIGVNAGSFNDFYNLSGTGTALTVTSNLYLGLSGNGNLTQSDGNVSVHNASASAFLAIGVNSNGNGTYNLSGGNLTADFLRVGETGTAVFSQSAGNITVNGNAIVSNGANSAPATYNYSGGTGTFTGGLSVGIKGFFNLQTGGALPFNVTVNSFGTFNLAGGSFGTGNVILNGGTLQLLGHSTTVSSHITGTGTIQNGSATAATLTFSPASTFSFASQVTDGPSAALGVTLTSGTLTLTGTDTYSGATTLQGGTLKIGAAAALSSASPIVLTGGTLDMQTFSGSIPSLSGTSNSTVILTTGTLTVAETSTNTYSGALTSNNVLTGASTFIKSLAGNTTLSNVSAFNGAFSVTGGTLTLGGTVAATSYSASNGGTLQLTGTSLTIPSIFNVPATINATGGTITQAGAASLTVGNSSSANVTIGAGGTFTSGTGIANISVFGLLTLAGGTFNENGNIDVIGTITQTGGTFNWAANHTLNIHAAGHVTLLGTYFTPTNANITLTQSSQFNNSGPSTANLVITNGATVSVKTGSTLHSDLYFFIGGSGTTGTVTIDGSSITSSALASSGENHLGTLGTGSLTLINSATGTVPNGFQLGNAAASNGTLSVQSSASLTTGSLDVATTPASLTGTINVTGGTITQTANATLGIGASSLSTGSVTIGTGGTFTTGTGAITIAATGTFNLQSGGSLNINGNVTNAGNLSLSGTQTWAANTTLTNTVGKTTFATNAKLYGLSITGGTVDVTSAKLIIEAATNKSTTLGNLQNSLANHTLTSSTLAANFGLALFDNALTNFATFGGNPADSSSLLLAPELLGDANIDGHVDLTDLDVVLNNLGTNTNAWTSGNFDHAAAIDLNDLNAVLNNLGVSFANNASVLAAEALVAATPTPEPTTLALLAFAAPLFIRRPRQV